MIVVSVTVLHLPITRLEVFQRQAEEDNGLQMTNQNQNNQLYFVVSLTKIIRTNLNCWPLVR